MPRKQLPQSDEQLVDLTFPLSGIDVSTEFELQPQNTTPKGQNVRTYEALTQRGRGGVRPGLGRYIAQQPSGSNLLQDLNSVTIVLDSALMTGFDPFNAPLAIEAVGVGFVPYIGGQPLVFPQVTFGPLPPTQGGQLDPSTNNTIGRGVRIGGSGIQLNKNVGTRISTLSGTLTASQTNVPNDGTTATITATIKFGGVPQGGKTVVLSTSPSGRVGDGVSAVTNGLGQAQWTVSDMNPPEAVTYSAVDTSDMFTIPQTVTITYGGIQYIQSVSSGSPFNVPITTWTWTLPGAVTMGNLLLMGFRGTNTGNDKVTDSQGNVWTQLSTPWTINTQLWYAIANQSNLLTVTVTLAHSLAAVGALLEYGGTLHGNPFDSATGQTNSILATSAIVDTTSVPVNGNAEWVVGFIFAEQPGPGAVTGNPQGCTQREFFQWNPGAFYSLYAVADIGPTNVAQDIIYKVFAPIAGIHFETIGVSLIP